MSMLLTKRLARSLWRTKLRLSAVVFMVAVGVFAGISFGTYANAATSLYDGIYDGEDGINLADIWVENPSGIWNESTSDNICSSIENDWPDSDYKLEGCESRLILNGMMFTSDSSGNEKAIPIRVYCHQPNSTFLAIGLIYDKMSVLTPSKLHPCG